MIHISLYFDTAATTPVPNPVCEAMRPYLVGDFDLYGNPNSVHSFGLTAKEAVERARKSVAALIGAEPEQIVFFPSATLANRAVLDLFLRPDCSLNAEVSVTEHSSVFDYAAQKNGRFIGLPENAVDFFASFASWIEAKTSPLSRYPSSEGSLVSVMLVNNETGAVNPVKELARISHEFKRLFHTDATAAAGAMSIDVKELDCDFLTFSAHKMYGPKGAAALYVRDPKTIERLPYMGTDNVPAVVGFGKACEYSMLWQRLNRHLRECDNDYQFLAERFTETLAASLDEEGFILNTPIGTAAHLDKILNIRFDGVDAETLVLLCSTHGLMISAGSACDSREQKPSRVLLAMGLIPEQARSSVRISFGRFTTPDEAENGARILADCVNFLREAASRAE